MTRQRHQDLKRLDCPPQFVAQNATDDTASQSLVGTMVVAVVTRWRSVLWDSSVITTFDRPIVMAITAVTMVFMFPLVC